MSDERGISIVEVLAVTLVVGIAVVGVALMFGKGSAWVSAIGSDRVAAGLAQERIEQIRAAGWGAATAAGTVGTLLVDEPITAGHGQRFVRTVCIQYVDPATREGLGGPAYAPPDCPAGAETTAVRVTVVVATSPRQPETTPVTLQAWMSQAGP